MPTWVLALMYWLHLLATVVWVGGLALMALIVWPTLHARLGVQSATVFAELHRRFNPWAWLSLAVLVGTGLFQMTADKNYRGWLQIENAWALAILLKHVVVAGMVVIGLMMQLWIQPALARLALLADRGKPVPVTEAESLRKRESLLMWLNLVCAALVLLCTAIATAL
ncbi:MAG: CopD family protein [Anaerolineales bacterium]